MNTTEFLDRVRQTTQLPDTDEDWTVAQILTEATNALYERFTQPVANLRHGYWLHRHTFTTTAGVAKYRLPPRAIVQGLETIEVSLDGNGQNWQPLAILTNFQATFQSSESRSNRPTCFELEGDSIRVYPTPNGAFPIRTSYYLRPSVLIPYQPDGAGVIATVSPTQIVLEAPFEGMDLVAIDYVDLIHTTGCNEVILPGVLAGLSGSNVNFSPALSDEVVSQIVPGRDVVRFADQTDFIPLPIELHTALVAWVSAVILAQKGDAEKAGVFSKKADSAIQRIVDIAEPRIKSRPYAFTTRNTYLRRRGVSWGR